MPHYLIISDIQGPRTSRTVTQGPIEAANAEQAVEQVRPEVTGNAHGSKEDVTAYELAEDENGNPISFNIDP